MCMGSWWMRKQLHCIFFIVFVSFDNVEMRLTAYQSEVELEQHWDFLLTMKQRIIIKTFSQHYGLSDFLWHKVGRKNPFLLCIFAFVPVSIARMVYGWILDIILLNLTRFCYQTICLSSSERLVCFYQEKFQYFSVEQHKKTWRNSY